MEKRKGGKNKPEKPLEKKANNDISHDEA